MNVAEVNAQDATDAANEEAKKRILAALGDSSWSGITAAQPTDTTTLPASTAPDTAPASTTGADLLASANKIDQTTSSNQKQSALVASLSSAAPGIAPTIDAGTSAQDFERASYTPTATPQDFQKASYTPIAQAETLALPQDFQRASYTSQPQDQTPAPLALPQDFERASYTSDTTPQTGVLPLPQDFQRASYTPTTAATLANPDVQRAQLVNAPAGGVASFGLQPDQQPLALPQDFQRASYTPTTAATLANPEVRRAELVRIPGQGITGQDSYSASANAAPLSGDALTRFQNEQALAKLAPSQAQVTQNQQAPRALPPGSAKQIQPALPVNAEPFQPDTSGSKRINAIFNNPGAMGMTQSAIRFGATPSGKYDTGHAFAQFPTKEAGAAAQFSMWQNPQLYKGHTLAGAIQNWVGPGETGEAEFISKKTGIPLNTVITDDFLRGPQGIRLMQAQAQYEGQNVLTPEQWQRGQDWAYKGTKPDTKGQVASTTTTTTTGPTTTTTTGPTTATSAQVNSLIDQKTNTIKMPKLEDIGDDITKKAQYQALQVAKSMQDAGIPIDREKLQNLITSQYSALQSQQVEIAKEQREMQMRVQEEAAKRGLPVKPSSADATQLADASAGFDMMDNLQRLYDQSVKLGHAGNWPVVSNPLNKLNPDVIAYEAARSASMTPTAKGIFGNTGNLSEFEQKSALQTLPELGDSQQVFNAKMANIRLLIANKQIERMEGLSKANIDMSNFAPDYKKYLDYRNSVIQKTQNAPGIDQSAKNIAQAHQAAKTTAQTTTVVPTPAPANNQPVVQPPTAAENYSTLTSANPSPRGLSPQAAGVVRAVQAKIGQMGKPGGPSEAELLEQARREARGYQ